MEGGQEGCGGVGMGLGNCDLPPCWGLSPGPSLPHGPTDQIPALTASCWHFLGFAKLSHLFPIPPPFLRACLGF